MRQDRGVLWLRLRAQKIQWAVDAFLISAAASITVAFLLGQIHPLWIRLGEGVVLVGSCLGLLVVRLVVGSMTKRLNDPVNFTRGSHSELLADLPHPTQKMIEQADEIQILAGTLIDFVRREADLKALATAAGRGAKIQIIMLDPAAEILRTIAMERSSRSRNSAEEILKRLQSECIFSISRFEDVLPAATFQRALRLSSAMPHQAFARYGDRYLLAPYIFGRGGGSPAMFFRRSATNRSLCDGLRQGFEEQWGSSMVREVGEEVPAGS